MTEATQTPVPGRGATAGQRVSVGYEGSVAVVTMRRPDKHNALDWPMFEGLQAAAAELADRRDVRAVVLAGEGPSFCSGLDFPSFIDAAMPIEAMLDPRPGDAANVAQGVSLDWQRLPVPVIAALQGACYGGGAQIALGADLRIAAPDMRLSVMEIKWGLIPDMGLTRTLPRLVRIDVAKELTFSGRVVTAAEACELGLVTSLADDPFASARALAERIAAQSPHAIRAAKRLLNEAWEASEADALALEAASQRGLLGSPNQIAAVTAGLSKQPARYVDPE